MAASRTRSCERRKSFDERRNRLRGVAERFVDTLALITAWAFGVDALVSDEFCVTFRFENLKNGWKAFSEKSSHERESSVSDESGT